MLDSARHWPDALILVLASVLLFTGLGSHSIHNADEARYAIVIDEMLEDGSTGDFTLRDEPYFNKAPLRIQTSHLLARTFGLSPWTLRLPSAVMGLVAVGVLLALGRFLFDVESSRWAALVLITSTQFLYVHGARSGEMDSTLVALWWGALLAAMLARERPAALWVCAALIGLTGLVKHLAYVAPVTATVLFWWAWRRELRAIGIRRLLIAALLVAAVALPWHLVQIARHGMDFVNGYLGREVVERVTREHELGYGWPFYFSVIKDGLWPWSLLLPFAVLRGWTNRAARFLLLLAAVMVAGLLAARGDLSWYALPALPALALLIGRWVPGGGRLAWLAIAIVFALSPSNVMDWDVHQHFAIEGLIEGDLLGLLQGARPWVPQLAVGGMLLLGLGVWTAGRAKIGRQMVLAVFAGFAVVHAALPLRTAFDRSDIDQLSLDLDGIDGVVWVAPGTLADNSVVYYHLERAADRVDLVGTPVDRDPDRWCVIRETDLAESPIPAGALRRGEWVALPPDSP